MLGHNNKNNEPPSKIYVNEKKDIIFDGIVVPKFLFKELRTLIKKVQTKLINNSTSVVFSTEKEKTEKEIIINNEIPTSDSNFHLEDLKDESQKDIAPKEKPKIYFNRYNIGFMIGDRVEYSRLYLNSLVPKSLDPRWDWIGLLVDFQDSKIAVINWDHEKPGTCTTYIHIDNLLRYYYKKEF